MSNHYHLVLRTDEPSLSEGMQSLNARYAQHFNLAYELSGHVFQGRYRADLIDNERYLLTAIRYVELNPLNAGLCTTASEWPWSSFAAVVGSRSHNTWFDRAAVLALFASDPNLAIARFTQFITDNIRTNPPVNTAVRRARLERDRSIREAHATGVGSIRVLAEIFNVSPATVLRALRCFTEGSDPSVKH